MTTNSFMGPGPTPTVAPHCREGHTAPGQRRPPAAPPHAADRGGFIDASPPALADGRGRDHHRRVDLRRSRRVRGVVVQAPGRAGRGEPPDVGGVRANPPTERPGGNRGGARGHPREARADAARGQGLSVREIGGLRAVLGARRLSGGGPRSSLRRRPPPHRPRNDERPGGLPRTGDHSGPCLCGVGWERYALMPSRSNARPPGSAAAAWRPCASPLSPQPMPRRARCSSASTIQRWLSICSRRSRIGTAACGSPLSRTARPRS
jgi:hypothetical protein